MSRLWRWLLSGASVGLIAFFFIKLSGAIQEQAIQETWRADLAASVLIGAVVSAAIIPISGFAWAILLRQHGESWRPVTLAGIMGATQFAKYVPGNLLQHLGRVALSRSFGMKASTLVATVLTEFALASVASLTVGIILIAPRGAPIWYENTDSQLQSLAVAGLVFGTAAAITIALSSKALRKRLASWLGQLATALRPRNLPTTAAVFSLYCINYLLIGGAAWVVFRTLGLRSEGDFALVVGSFAVAWILGFLAPGAPAGLGVRESVMYAILSSYCPPQGLVPFLFFLRIMTMVSDGITTLAGLTLVHLERPASEH